LTASLDSYQKSSPATPGRLEKANIILRAAIRFRCIYLKSEEFEGIVMETLQAIKTRRSIRKFLDRPVPDKMIREILEAAMFAPSAGNEQPWQFIVLDDRALLDAVPKICATASMCRQSAVAILVCSDSSLEKYPGFWVQDCSAAVENMLLAAHELELGAVWAGIHPLKDRIMAFKKLLSLPEEIMPFALVAIGYPNEAPAMPQRYREDRVHHNGW